MAVQPRDIEREIRVPAGEQEVKVGTVSAGETWSFAASGRWTNGFIACGPDGYRNFLFDALQIEPRVAGQPWFRLVGEIKGRPGSAFAIGAGCTRTFHESGELVVFANDSANGYSDNKGDVALSVRKGGLAPAPPTEYGGFIGWWHAASHMHRRTRGVLLIAVLLLAISWILVFMQQGQDLVRGIGEDNFTTSLRKGFLQVAFAIGLLFLAVEAWSWARIVVTSNYGADRRSWRPKLLLVWGPRLLGVLPFAASILALWRNPARNSGFILALVLVGLVFFVFVVRRQDVRTQLRRRAAAHGMARHFDLIQRYWVIFSLAAAAVLMVVATLRPAGFGFLLGAPAIVFIGVALIIPVSVIGVQTGSSLRFPVVGTMLLLAVVFGVWVDNHAVGRRAFGRPVTGPTDRLTLKDAYELWKTASPPNRDGKRTMVLVASQGGASRAGYWTAAALARLREAASAKNADFDSHVFAISSVSGGSVGAVGYAAMLKSAPDPSGFRDRLLAFAGRDALGPTMAGMMFPDLLQRFLPVAFLPDRAEALERSWEDAWKESGVPPSANGVIAEPFLNLAPKKGQWRPILIVQGASEDGGRRFLTSGVRFACDEVDADDFLDSVGHDVAASTAILNGARFPWVSPGGTFKNVPRPDCVSNAGSKRVRTVTDHILDGGYFDNAGAETLREMVRALHAIRAQANDTDPLEIVFVLIGYRDAEGAKPTPRLATNDVFAPFFGLFHSLDAHESHLAREMKLVGQSKLEPADPYVSRMDGGDFDYAAIVLCKGKLKPEGPDYEPPMDWTLSEQAKRYLESALIEKSPACDAETNVPTIDAVVEKLRR